MKFGVNSFIWAESYSDTVSALLPWIREQGFDGVEVPLIDPAEFPADRIRHELSAHGLECTVCSVLPSDLSLASANPSIRAKTVNHLKDVARATADAGSSLVAGPLYTPVGCFTGARRTRDEWLRVVEGLSAVSETLAEHRVTLAVEPLNRFETYFLNITADAVQLCKEIGSPQIGILLDTFHANIEEKQLGDAFRLAGPWLCHVHTCENDRGTPGSGHVPWPDVFAALEAIHYDGWLTIESFGFSLGKLSAAASIWRDIELTPDQIAAEGLPFLRHQAALPATNSSRTSGKPSLS